MKAVNLKPLLDAIDANKMMSKWGDSLFSTPETQEELAEEKREKVIKEYQKIMNSPKNNGSEEYQSWAIGTVLKINRAAKSRLQTKSKLR